LIVAAMNDRELTHLVRAADDCGIDALVEVHDEPDLKRALDAGAIFIGINNRNLAAFEVDVRTTEGGTMVRMPTYMAAYREITCDQAVLTNLF
jgi:indole-3-glycerol phosphate synthase